MGLFVFTECDICKLKICYTRECKHSDLCKLYVMNVDEGIVRVRKMNANAKLPVRETAGAENVTWLRRKLQ